MRQAGAIDDDGCPCITIISRLVVQRVVEISGIADAATILEVGDQAGDRVRAAIRTSQQLLQVIGPQAFGRRHALVAGGVVEHEGAVGRQRIETGCIHRPTDDGTILGLVADIGANAVDDPHLQDRSTLALGVVPVDVDVRIGRGAVAGDPVGAIGHVTRHEHVSTGIVGNIDIAEGKVVGGVVDDVHRRRAVRFHRACGANVDVCALQVDVGAGRIDVVQQQYPLAIVHGLARVETTIQCFQLRHGEAGVTNTQVGAAVETVANGDIHVVGGTGDHLAVHHDVTDDRAIGGRVGDRDRNEAQLVTGRAAAGLVGEVVAPRPQVDITRANQRRARTQRRAHAGVDVGHCLDHRNRDQATHIAFGRCIDQQVALLQRGSVLARRQVGVLQ